MKEKPLLFIALLILAFGILVLVSVGLFPPTYTSLPNTCVAEPGYYCSGAFLLENGTLYFQFGQATGHTLYNTTMYVLSGSKLTKQNITAIKFLGVLKSDIDLVGVHEGFFEQNISIAKMTTVSHGVLWITAGTSENGTISVSEEVAVFSAMIIKPESSGPVPLIGLALVLVAIIILLYVYRKNRRISK